MPIKFIRSIKWCFYLSVLLSNLALADIVVIVHKDNNAELSKKTIQRIFLGKEKKFSNGKETLPINQVDSSAVRKAFDSSILGRNTTQVLAHWSKLVFTGKGIPPKEVGSDAEVLAIITDNKNAIGYVDRASVNDKVKIFEFEAM